MKDSHNTGNNSVPSILAALRYYDGCEFDVRLTRDRVLVLYHDAKYNGRRLLETDFKDLKGVQALKELIDHPQVIESINDNGKTLWIETKEDTTLGKKRDPVYCQELAGSITDQLKGSDLKPENIRIISFSSEILKHINGFRTGPHYEIIFSYQFDLIQ